MTSSRVDLYIYDLSKGMAAIMSPIIIGKKIDGVWHTAITVYEREYFFTASGVENCIPGTTALGPPLKQIKLGETQVPYPVFIEYLNGLSQSSYGANTYQLLSHNCNNFSDELAQFLCGTGIPKYILDLPNEVLQTNLGSTLVPLISQWEQSARPTVQTQSEATTREKSPDLDQQIEEARYKSFVLEQRRKKLKEKLAKRERKKEKRRKKLIKEGHSEVLELEETEMADTEAALNPSESSLPSEQAMQLEEEERRQEEERKRLRDPPVIYKTLHDINVEFDALVGLIDGKLSQEEQTSLEELHKFMLEDEGSWVLGETFLVFIGRLLNDKTLPVEVRVKTLNVLALAALKDDVILLLHQDRREHILMNYAFDIDRHSLEEQEGVALFMCNMFENLSSSEWMLYISEWAYNNQQTSNIRVTTKVAVHSLLSDSSVLQERGSAIIHNLACKEVKTVVFDDVAVELTMALLQFFNGKPSEENLFRCMKALAKFVEISRQEVPQLIQMIGPDPKTFKGTSPRIDELIEKISSKCR
ncbi:PREDICTED: uncharacterized protein LOC108567030 isoform X2 [Nicrophorus vespilloides]|uniref:Uncharacterized protein LOC108567030 isoform X2 n=1 Tax=Nicrophorus vespilloides TaxID=110193 RepID=A0ABM1N7A4_NICVS|nr:PREDICTED: uncharacterized protein LOC108567030 isoform X2 [Nicrophorus vespilloides]